MEFAFRNDKHERDKLNLNDPDFSLKGKRAQLFWGLLIAILLTGTAPIDLTVKYLSVATLTLFLAGITEKMILMNFSWNYFTKSLMISSLIILNSLNLFIITETG